MLIEVYWWERSLGHGLELSDLKTWIQKCKNANSETLDSKYLRLGSAAWVSALAMDLKQQKQMRSN